MEKLFDLITQLANSEFGIALQKHLLSSWDSLPIPAVVLLFASGAQCAFFGWLTIKFRAKTIKYFRYRYPIYASLLTSFITVIVIFVAADKDVFLSKSDRELTLIAAKYQAVLGDPIRKAEGLTIAAQEQHPDDESGIFVDSISTVIKLKKNGSASSEIITKYRYADMTAKSVGHFSDFFSKTKKEWYCSSKLRIVHYKVFSKGTVIGPFWMERPSDREKRTLWFVFSDNYSKWYPHRSEHYNPSDAEDWTCS